MNDLLPGFAIRPYKPSDQPGVRWLHDRTPPAGQPASRPQPWPEALEDIAANFLLFLVAVEPVWDGEAIVGMAGLTRAGAPSEMTPLPAFVSSDPQTARLDYVRVAPERQRRGIGRALTQAAIEWAGQNGYRRVVLETTPEQAAAVGLYTAMGFSEIGRSTIGRWELAWFELSL